MSIVVASFAFACKVGGKFIPTGRSRLTAVSATRAGKHLHLLLSLFTFSLGLQCVRHLALVHKLHLRVVAHRHRRDLLVVQRLLEVIVDCLSDDISIRLLGNPNLDVAATSSALAPCHRRRLQNFSRNALRLPMVARYRSFLREALVVAIIANALLADRLRIFGMHFQLNLLHGRHLRVVQDRLGSLLGHCSLSYIWKHSTDVLV